MDSSSDRRFENNDEDDWHSIKNLEGLQWKISKNQFGLTLKARIWML